MWLLKLQYEFYNPRFYGTERNFSHQGQRQEKWDRISEMGLGRGKDWGRGVQNDKDADRANFLTFTSLSTLSGPTAGCHVCSLHPEFSPRSYQGLIKPLSLTPASLPTPSPQIILST